MMSWAPQATTESGQWVGNGLRFATREEAEAYVPDFPRGATLPLLNHPIPSIAAGRMGGSQGLRTDVLSCHGPLYRQGDGVLVTAILDQGIVHSDPGRISVGFE
jgi:hypothetical protein